MQTFFRGALAIVLGCAAYLAVSDEAAAQHRGGGNHGPGPGFQPANHPSPAGNNGFSYGSKFGYGPGKPNVNGQPLGTSAPGFRPGGTGQMLGTAQPGFGPGNGTFIKPGNGFPAGAFPGNGGLFPGGLNINVNGNGNVGGSGGSYGSGGGAAGSDGGDAGYATAPGGGEPASAETEAVAESPAQSNQILYAGVGLFLRNPDKNRLAVSFTADGQAYTLKPGEQLKLDTQPSWKIVFNRGTDLGDARYQVADGKAYNFGVAPTTGWDLYETSLEVAPTNTTPALLSPESTTPVAATETAEAAPPGIAKELPPLRKGDTVVVVPASATVKSGSRALATVQRDQSLKVLDVRGNWVLVDVGQPEYGWIRRSDVRAADSADAPAGVTRE